MEEVQEEQEKAYGVEYECELQEEDEIEYVQDEEEDQIEYVQDEEEEGNLWVVCKL